MSGRLTYVNNAGFMRGLIPLVALASFLVLEFDLVLWSGIIWRIPAVQRAYFRRVIRNDQVPEA